MSPPGRYALCIYVAPSTTTVCLCLIVDNQTASAKRRLQSCDPGSERGGSSWPTGADLVATSQTECPAGESLHVITSNFIEGGCKLGWTILRSGQDACGDGPYQNPYAGSYGCCLPDAAVVTEMVCTNQNSGYGFQSGAGTMSTVTANGVSYCGDFHVDGSGTSTANPYSAGNSIGRIGQNEYVDPMCIGGVKSTVSYHSFENSYGVENEWNIGGCSGLNANGGDDYPEGESPDFAGATATFTAECCIPYSGADLTCVDTYNDGWDGNYLTIGAFPAGGPAGDGLYCLGTDNGDDTWTFNDVFGGTIDGIACAPYAPDDGEESRCATNIALPVGDLPLPAGPVGGPVDGAEFAGGQEVSFAMSTDGTLALLTRVSTSGDMASAGRSYDGFGWEGVQPTHLEFECSATECIVNLPSGVSGDIYRVSVHSAPEPASDEEAFARFLLHGTFGPKRSEIEALMSSAEDVATTMANWVGEQIDLPLSSHREYNRKRANGRSRFSGSNGENPIGRISSPCANGSRWHAYAFSKDDEASTVVASANAVGGVDLAINGVVRTQVASFDFTYGSASIICWVTEEIDGAIVLGEPAACQTAANPAGGNCNQVCDPLLPPVCAPRRTLLYRGDYDYPSSQVCTAGPIAIASDLAAFAPAGLQLRQLVAVPGLCVPNLQRVRAGVRMGPLQVVVRWRRSILRVGPVI